MSEKINVDNVGQGYFAEKFNDALEMIGNDIYNRPGVDAFRIVRGEVKIKPMVNQMSGEVMAVIEWSVKPAIPGSTGSQTRGEVEDGSVMVSAHSLDSRQKSMFDEEENNITPIKKGQENER